MNYYNLKDTTVLCHYGVPGMKWGEHKFRKEQVLQTLNNKKAQLENTIPRDPVEKEYQKYLYKDVDAKTLESNPKKYNARYDWDDEKLAEFLESLPVERRQDLLKRHEQWRKDNTDFLKEQSEINNDISVINGNMRTTFGIGAMISAATLAPVSMLVASKILKHKCKEGKAKVTSVLLAGASSIVVPATALAISEKKYQMDTIKKYTE